MRRERNKLFPPLFGKKDFCWTASLALVILLSFYLGASGIDLATPPVSVLPQFGKPSLFFSAFHEKNN